MTLILSWYIQNLTANWQLKWMLRILSSWWRHQMKTFSALLAICEGNSPVPGEFPAQRPVTRSFDVLFDLRPNKRLSKQWWGWRFETPWHPLWRHCNVLSYLLYYNNQLSRNPPEVYFRQDICPIGSVGGHDNFYVIQKMPCLQIIYILQYINIQGESYIDIGFDNIIGSTHFSTKKYFLSPI